MTTTQNAPAVLTSGQPEKPYKAPALTVDNLRHFSDHGCAVQFSNPRLRSLVEYIAGRDGTIHLKSGKSTVEIVRQGRVTLTRAFFSVGRRSVQNIHYFDSSCGLKYIVKRDGDKDEKHAFQALASVIFGDALPSFFTPSTGGDQDLLRRWLRVGWSWSLTGESGLRAQAASLFEDSLQASINSAERHLYYTREELQRFVRFATPEHFAEKQKDAREHAQATLSRFDSDVSLLEQAAEFFSNSDNALLEGNADRLRQHGREAGAHRGYDSHFYFREQAATYSHEIRRPNYRAYVSGDTVSFNSGITCEFTFSRLVAWLEGNATAPATRYGTVYKLEVGLPETLEPRVFLVCGCHYIDAAADVPALASLLKPSHTVTQTAGKPRARLADDGKAFCQRAQEEAKAKIANLQKQRAEKVASYARKRHNLEKQAADVPAAIASRTQAVTEAEQALAKTREAKASFKMPVGASVENVKHCALAFLGALIGKGAV